MHNFIFKLDRIFPVKSLKRAFWDHFRHAIDDLLSWISCKKLILCDFLEAAILRVGPNFYLTKFVQKMQQIAHFKRVSKSSKMSQKFKCETKVAKVWQVHIYIMNYMWLYESAHTWTLLYITISIWVYNIWYKLHIWHLVTFHIWHFHTFRNELQETETHI